jgi:hypothetical protein
MAYLSATDSINFMNNLYTYPYVTDSGTATTIRSWDYGNRSGSTALYSYMPISTSTALHTNEYALPTSTIYDYSTTPTDYVAVPYILDAPTGSNYYLNPNYNWYSGDALTNTLWAWGSYTQRDAKRIKLQWNSKAPLIKSRACPIEKISKAEQIALDTLREMISESDYRKYLKHGFVLVEGTSGDTYQIFRRSPHTKIWRDGILMEEVCVKLKDFDLPPTDNVIAFIAMVQTNEEEFKALGNRYKMYQKAA